MSTYHILEGLAAQLGRSIDSIEVHRFRLTEGHGLASGGECAHAVFRRINDGVLLWLTVTPSMAAARQWQYSVSVLNGRELTHGHLRLDMMPTLGHALDTLWSAFRGEPSKRNRAAAHD